MTPLGWLYAAILAFALVAIARAWWPRRADRDLQRRLHDSAWREERRAMHHGRERVPRQDAPSSPPTLPTARGFMERGPSPSSVTNPREVIS